MSALGYPAIKGTTAGTPGTGAFTPNAAATQFRPWSKVGNGWMGLVRYEDTGGAWELCFSYWNGSTLSRSATQFYDSSTGSPLSLSSSATAALVDDPFAMQPLLGMNSGIRYVPNPNNTNWGTDGTPSAPSITGTAGGVGGVSTSNIKAELPRTNATSATTASAQAGYTFGDGGGCFSGGTAGRGGFIMATRFGVGSPLPTGPRFFAGLLGGAATMVGASEPSAVTANMVGLLKDSTDTNLQFATNGNTGTATKQDTGIALVGNGLYELAIWHEPGASEYWLRLFRVDTGAIFVGVATTNLPASLQLAHAQIMAGLNATNTGTAIGVECCCLAQLPRR